jgi:peptide/nickel transport system permease protein
MNPTPSSARAAAPPTRRANWPLLLGAAIVLLYAALAVAGPWIAPRSPLERVAVVRTPEGPVGPPFPLLTPGFPLGSDRFGRDLLSRLIWAVQPTMILVVTVAAVRLAAGLAIGVAAGWAEGRARRSLETLIGAALAVPTLIVALAAIAVIGIERGLPAFIAGLALTGWVETARVVGDVTRSIKRQPFTQASLALGAPGGYIVARHVLRHLTPLIGMLLAIEISGTLMLAVALGFLGYYIGGGVWVVMDGDAIPVAQRATEYPELGQMLATSLERILDPRPMVIVGATIFVAILGFNMLGEGLRRRASELTARPSLLGRGLRPLETALAQLTLRPAAARSLGAAALLVALTSGAALWWRGSASANVAPAPLAATPIPVPGGHPWPAERGDPSGTLAASWIGEAAPALGWTFEAESDLSGGPAVASDGSLYVASQGGALYALDPEGQLRWSAELPAPAFGSPAIGADGTVYVADAAAGLSAFSPAGELRWHFQSAARREGTSGPVIGADGTIYYTLVDRVQAVRPDGSGAWVSEPADAFLEVAPRVSPSGDLVFLKDMAVSAADGSRLPFALGGDDAEFSDPTYFVGADGATYFRHGHVATEWRRAEEGAAPSREVSWDAARSATFFPADAGATRGRVVWMLYSAAVADTRVVWIGQDGALLGNAFFQERRSRVIGVGDDATVFLCGSGRNGRLQCGAYQPISKQPRWQLALPVGGDVIGGALAEGRMYVATRDALFAIAGSGPSPGRG